MPSLPQIKGDRLVNALSNREWHVDRTRGSHVIMRNESKPGTKIVIPIHRRPIKPGILYNILKIAGLSVEEIKELL